jgi:hypothetical protein
MTYEQGDIMEEESLREDDRLINGDRSYPCPFLQNLNPDGQLRLSQPFSLKILRIPQKID